MITNIRKIFFLFYLLLQGCIGGISWDDTITDDYYEQRRRSLEIADLIDIFVASAGASYNAGDYQQGSQARPIVWEQTPVMGAANQFGDYFARTGELYITADSNFFPFILKDRLEPVPWKITISGAHAGYVHILLREQVFTHEFVGFEEYFKKKNILLSERETVSTALGAGYSSKKMKLMIKGREVTVLECLNCGGNSGCAIDEYFSTDGKNFDMSFDDIELGQDASHQKKNLLHK